MSGLTGIGDLIVRGLRGDDVLLPCSYSKAGELSANASVLWIDPNDKVVVKLRQNLMGNAFASSFPEEQKKGNFSIVVKNAQPSHSGMYLCSIPTISHTKKIYLNVSGLCWRIISAPTGALELHRQLLPSCLLQKEELMLGVAPQRPLQHLHTSSSESCFLCFSCNPSEPSAT